MRVHVSHGGGSGGEMVVAGGTVLVVVVRTVAGVGTDDVAVAPATVVGRTEVDVVPADPEQPAARTMIAAAQAVVLSLFKVGLLNLTSHILGNDTGTSLVSCSPRVGAVQQAGAGQHDGQQTPVTICGQHRLGSE